MQHVFDTPVSGQPSEYCQTIWYRKTRMVWCISVCKSSFPFAGTASATFNDLERPLTQVLRLHHNFMLKVTENGMVRDKESYNIYLLCNRTQGTL